MRKQNIGLIGILLFILVIVSIDLASAQVLRVSLGLKTVGATTAFCRDKSSVLGKRSSMAKELSDASLEL